MHSCHMPRRGEADRRRYCPPFLVWHGRVRILIDDVGRNRKGMLVIRRAHESPLLPGTETILSHQPNCSPPADDKAAVLRFPRHARAHLSARSGRRNAKPSAKMPQTLPKPSSISEPTLCQSGRSISSDREQETYSVNRDSRGLFVALRVETQ